MAAVQELWAEFEHSFGCGEVGHSAGKRALPQGKQRPGVVINNLQGCS